VAGTNRRVGRPRVDDPKTKIPSFYLKQSTIIDIEVFAEKLGMSKSDFMQQIMENGLNIIKLTKK